MTFEEILDQATAMLQRRGRLTYSTLKRQFQLDDAALVETGVLVCEHGAYHPFKPLDSLQVMANNYLGVAYHILGDHRRAMGLLRSNVESLAGDLLHERFGLAGLPAVLSRAWLARCLAELGAFPEGLAHGEEAVRIAEAVDHPHSLLSMRVSASIVSPSARGTSPGLFPCSNAASISAGFITYWSGSPKLPRPWAVHMPLLAVSPRPCRCWSRRSRGVLRWGPWAVSRCGLAM